MNRSKVLYRSISRSIGKKLIVPSFFSESHRKELAEMGQKLTEVPVSDSYIRVWFHAASVGELESLWTVVTEFANQPGRELILTVFSESARQALSRLCASLEGRPAKVVFCGYSPWEGDWISAIEKLQPDVFVTAKYEAWPDLWMVLADQKIPLIMVGAKLRSALIWAKRICGMLGAALPEMRFLTVLEKDEKELREAFPRSVVQTAGEPRWDRVFERAAQGSARVKRLVEAAQNLPRPWGVMGSVWLEDLKRWAGLWPTFGTIWLVPHRIDPSYLESVELFFCELKIPLLKTSGVTGDGARPIVKKNDLTFVLVDEMGFLSELYASGDWAFVGGGYGKGLHSTIEPAIHGIPVAGGPARADRFAEVAEMISTGQLKIIPSVDELKRWVDGPRNADLEQRGIWKSQANGRRGGTERVLRTILDVAKRPCYPIHNK